MLVLGSLAIMQSDPSKLPFRGLQMCQKHAARKEGQKATTIHAIKNAKVGVVFTPLRGAALLESLAGAVHTIQQPKLPRTCASVSMYMLFHSLIRLVCASQKRCSAGHEGLSHENIQPVCFNDHSMMFHERLQGALVGALPVRENFKSSFSSRLAPC